MLHKAYKNTELECIRADMRTKLSVTIDSDLIRWVEKQIEKKVFRSKRSCFRIRFVAANQRLGRTRIVSILS